MAKKKRDDLHGLLLVDKPGLEHRAERGEEYLLSSHDVVNRARRWSGQRRIGHTGTLDPMASGLMMLCLGGATRLVEYYQGHDKVYEAEVTLGRATDTYDAVGETVAEAPIPELTTSDIAQALAQFHGEIEQRPPVYSALKQDGESLHRKARRGESVEIPTRPVTIHSSTLLQWNTPHIRLRVHVSAGTYVRSLAHDLGEALGTVAHLSFLRRETIGDFQLSQAHTLAQIEAATEAGKFASLLLPTGQHLGLPTITVSADIEKRLGFGQKVWLDWTAPDRTDTTHCTNTTQRPETLQAVGEDGRFLGILAGLDWSDDGRSMLCKADKWLVPLLYGTI